MIYIVYIPNKLILGLASILNGMQTHEAIYVIFRHGWMQYLSFVIPSLDFWVDTVTKRWTLRWHSLFYSS